MSAAADWMDHPETWLGMKVDVTLVDDQTRHKGEIITMTPFFFEGEALSEHCPTIRLDDGREVSGIQCWWTKDTPELP